MERQSVAELVRECAAGRNPEVWCEFVERFENRLHAGVHRALARCEAQISEQEREDLMQEIYFRLLDRRGKCLRQCRGREEGVVGAFLGRVAENVVLDYLRSISAVKRGKDRLVDVQFYTDRDPTWRAIDPRPTPEELLLAREQRDALLIGCQKVIGTRTPRRDFQIFYLAVFEGWSSREICRKVSQDLKPSTVDS